MTAIEEGANAYHRGKHEFTANRNKHHNEDEMVNSDMDSEDGLEFNDDDDDDEDIDIRDNYNNHNEQIDNNSNTATRGTFKATNTGQEPREKGDEEINELIVRRKPKKKSVKNNGNNMMEHNNTNGNNQDEEIKNESDKAPKKETKTQRFKREEANWSKSRRYSNVWSNGGALQAYGKMYERHQEEIKRRGKRKKAKSKKRKQQSVIPVQPQLKEEEFCYEMGTIKIHLENEHLDGVKPEDIIPYVPESVKYKRISIYL